jgi:ATP-dependent Lon protease
MNHDSAHEDRDKASPGTGPELDQASPEEPLEIVQVAKGRPEHDDRGEIEIPKHLPILPIRDETVFPGTVMPLNIRRGKAKRVLDLALAGSRLIAVVAQRSADVEDPTLDDLYRVGTACMILKMFKAADGSEMIVVHGLSRVGIEAVTHQNEYLEAIVHPYRSPVEEEQTKELEALMHSARQTAQRIIQLSPNVPDEALVVLQAIKEPGTLADFLAANLSLSLVPKQELLETFDVRDRLRKVHVAAVAQLEVVELANKIQDQVRQEVDRSQREYYLRQQMKAIREELGDSDTRGKALVTLREKVEAARMPDAVHAEAQRELDRLENIPAASPEYSMVLDYIEWLAELPWSMSTEDNLDIERAARILDEDHYGLEKIKKRILEFLAVRKLKKDSPGPILCFAGPPGTGKTSLGQSIARALGRKFMRISLGGVRDEAAIRGHRRTYVGAMPGTIIRELRKAGSNNPLFMLDEIDKLGQDFRGDPMSAMLEVLDPAQNSTFLDHYLGVPFDLSKILFITTANYMAAIQPALRDRMEVIELSSYTPHEKLMIARHHLLPRQLASNGLTEEHLKLSDEIIMAIITGYTREAGVRSLERELGALCRSRAAALVRGEEPQAELSREGLVAILGPRKFESEVAASLAVPGVVTALAFTPVGGEILFIEATKMPGSGNLNLTGQLGDVMRESAWAAYSLIRSRTTKAKSRRNPYASWDIHVHVPAGATPKDGPSAGVAMLSAMLSVLAGVVVDPLTGMTGEITLSGRVLPVGGVREKVLAARRAGLKRVIMPARNEQDLRDVPQDVREKMEFLFVRSVDELLDIIFEKASRAKHNGRKTAEKQAARPRRKRVAASPAGKAKAKKKTKSTSSKGRKRKAAKKAKSTRAARTKRPKAKTSRTKATRASKKRKATKKPARRTAKSR